MAIFKNLRNNTLQKKMSLVFIVANLFVFIVNMIMLSGINNMANEMDMVYQENLALNELSDALSSVQESMTDYLNTKTSDSMEDYYRNEQIYAQMVGSLSNKITGKSFGRMERNIKYMSEQYLDIANQTIDAKRGRNVEKYRIRYENATTHYNYINTYINSLNNEQFKNNSDNYRELSAAFRLFETVSMIVLFTVIIGNVFFIVLLTGTITSPLKVLAQAANEIAKGNFGIELLEERSRDETGIVTKAFNKMIVSIRHYIEQIRQNMEIESAMKEKELMMEAHLKDAQLKYLQAQINPHFLFNTLNAGAQLAMMEGADKTYEYVQNMADFFRYNVKKSNATVSLREEIELVDNYIYILNVRFSGEIHFKKQIDNTLLDISIPSMILQPIVENSVNHGIREITWDGMIELSVYRIDDVACISIKDNGVGMAPDKINQILSGTYRQKDSSVQSNGIGMDNVMNRLKLFSDSEDVMTIVCDGPDKGTEVIIYLQIKEREEEENV